MMAPVLEKVADKYAGRLKVAKLNVDESSKWAQKFNISAIPTLILFKGGVPVDKQIGFVAEAQLTGKIEGHLDAAQTPAKKGE
jgi:thioredoxin 1